MITRFDSLFTLTVSNNYYSGASADFDFLVPNDAQGLMRNRKLIAKVRAGVLHVLFESDQNGVPLISAAGDTIRIGLRLLNTNFFNFTNAGFVPGATTPIYRNAAAPTALDAF